MKRALFIMILSCLIVSAVTAQRPVKHNPKQYKVTEADNAGSISRDGRYLSYVDDQTDALFIRDLKTGESRRLTEERSAQSVDNITVISPDGKFVAYSWGTINRGVELRIIGLDGSKPRVVYRDKELNRVLPDAWSPDGKHILATFRKKDGTDQIVLVSVSDGSVRVLRTQKTLDLGHGHKESFSPDGRYIAFDFRPEAESLNRDISAIRVDGSGEVPLVQHSANDRLLDWTPDGTGILFASDRSGTWDLWVIVVVDGTPVGSPKLLKRDIGLLDRGLGFTRAGSYYYSILAWENDVYVATLNARTGKLQKPKKLIGHVGYDTSLQWSPDGKYLAYAYRDPNALGVRSVETDKEHQLRPKIGFFHFFQPHWSPDSRFVLGQGRKIDGTERQGLNAIDVRTGESRAIVTTNTQCPPDCIEWPAWSSDGRLYFTRWINWPQSIVVRDLETGQEKELYRSLSPATVSHLAVSPDGRQLAFVWYDFDAGKAALKVMPTSGGEPHELLTFPALSNYWLPLFALAWTPDSRDIVYAPTTASERKIEFWRISARGGKPNNLGLAMAGLEPFGLSIHPDGSRIAFTAGTPLHSEVWMLKDFLHAFKKAK